MNKYILHKLPKGFIITSNELIGTEDSYLWNNSIIKNHVVPTTEGDYMSNHFHRGLKVIAQQDQINFSSLSENDCKKIEWLDKLKLIEQFSKQGSWQCPISYEIGFQKAQELLSNRRFTLEEVKILMNWTASMVNGKKDSGLSISDITDELENKIKSLSQQFWNIEIETECSVCGLINEHKMSCKTPSLRTQQPKFINGKIKITKIC